MCGILLGIFNQQRQPRSIPIFLWNTTLSIPLPFFLHYDMKVE